MIVLHTLINEERHQAILDQYLDTFSEDFRSHILNYRRWQDAQLSLSGRILLQHGLKTYFHISEPDIRVSPNKKPYLRGNPVYFNISHSRDRVVCAIAEFPIGIDIEFLDRTINYYDFQFQMTKGEFEQIEHAEDKIKSFFNYWTRKEAVIKAHGDGMMIPLDTFEILNDECTIMEKNFFIKDLFLDENYQCCIASDDKNIKNVVPFFVPVKV
ncbi:4-phosphopantetheinyl transferase [Chryseobacterium phosphatilyticum]|uniref:4-phosphopantetheinyl transferase n=1 Tax=Chryseobacterium phosphatilyticum TaxID=475075 RepID=A0A316X478_9FLAO|nr:4'-phosphopantetheinyl transferase superfamily protein [Chryseobacterium phosphatilyticum]PWN68632.1 4-phosphopantetheinyl transferase [Chryseobacterium phosphatilyticum]